MRSRRLGRQLGALVFALAFLASAHVVSAACGDGVLQAGEACDDSAVGGDAACIGGCIPVGRPGECTCATPASDPRRYVAIANEQLRLGANTLVISGNTAATSPIAMMTIGRDVQLPSTAQAIGDTVHVLGGARVGRLFANQAALNGTADIVAGGPFPFTTPLALLAGLPAFPSFAPGSIPVDVPPGESRVLAPGAYGDVLIGEEARVMLRGLSPGSGAGIYDFHTLRVGFNARLTPLNPVVINVAERATVRPHAEFVPVAGLVGGDVQLNVDGRGVGLGAASTVAAHIHAPHGKARVGRGALFSGRVIALKISTAHSMLAAEGACGDGVLDAGEKCDASAPGGDAACPGQCIAGDPDKKGRIALGRPGQCTCTCDADTDCTDGNACNGVETCQAGVCVSGLPPNCNDNNPCTRDCDANVGCVTRPVTDGAGCSDGNTCTRGDSCQAGVCTPGEARDCSDNNSCTQDTCDPATGCAHAALADNTACADGNLCTQSDTCVAGKCIAGPTVNCGDQNPCTDDSCDPAKGCPHAALPDGTVCSDNNACTTPDTCQAGVCHGGQTPICIDNDPCTADVCDTVLGCQNPRLGDGTPCGPGGLLRCQAGVCQ